MGHTPRVWYDLMQDKEKEVRQWRGLIFRNALAGVSWSARLYEGTTKMRIKVIYVVNGATKALRLLCDEASIQLAIDAGHIMMVNGRDATGPISTIQGSHIEWAETRPSASDDEEWLKGQPNAR